MSNGPNSELPLRRYGERPVVLTRGGERLTGTMYALYPADEVPLVEVPSVDRSWFPVVWEARGWIIHKPTDPQEGNTT